MLRLTPDIILRENRSRKCTLSWSQGKISKNFCRHSLLWASQELPQSTWLNTINQIWQVRKLRLAIQPLQVKENQNMTGMARKGREPGLHAWTQDSQHHQDSPTLYLIPLPLWLPFLGPAAPAAPSQHPYSLMTSEGKSLRCQPQLAEPWGSTLVDQAWVTCPFLGHICGHARENHPGHMLHPFPPRCISRLSKTSCWATKNSIIYSHWREGYNTPRPGSQPSGWTSSTIINSTSICCFR